MKLYQAKNDEDYFDEMFQYIEKETDKKIFTMRILNHTEEGLETLVVFEDKYILSGIIKVTTIEGKLAIRMQGNFI